MVSRFKKYGFQSSQEADNSAQLLQKEYVGVIVSSVTLRRIPESTNTDSTSADSDLRSVFLPNLQ